MINDKLLTNTQIDKYIKARYKTLWTGEWSSGSITVPDSSKYNSFILVSGNMAFPCYRNSSGRIAGASGTAPGTTARYDRLFGATTNGDEWTIVWSKEMVHTANAGHGAISTATITEIIGLDPIY